MIKTSDWMKQNSYIHIKSDLNWQCLFPLQNIWLVKFRHICIIRKCRAVTTVLLSHCAAQPSMTWFLVWNILWSLSGIVFFFLVWLILFIVYVKFCAHTTFPSGIINLILIFTGFISDQRLTPVTYKQVTNTVNNLWLLYSVCDRSGSAVLIMLQATTLFMGRRHYMLTTSTPNSALAILRLSGQGRATWASCGVLSWLMPVEVRMFHHIKLKISHMGAVPQFRAIQTESSLTRSLVGHFTNV